MAAQIPIKSLIYKELQPMAQAAGLKLLVIDLQSYPYYEHSLEKKMARLGISQSEVDGLREALDDYQCIAIVRSNGYVGVGNVAKAFAKVGLDDIDVRLLNTVEGEKHDVWGQFDQSIPSRKRKFFYWFAVEVVDNKGNLVMES